jgi:hypothetical protein
MPAPEALGGWGIPAISVRAALPDPSDLSPPTPHRSQFGSADTRIGTPGDEVSLVFE